MSARKPEPFQIAIPEDRLQELQRRLAQVRWAPEIDNADWSYGTNGTYLRELVAYWHDAYDWRAQERAMNALPNFRVPIEDIPIHFVHVKGKGRRTLPLLLTHGWPWSYWDFHKVIGPLSDPAAHGGDPDDAFDLVVPSLPGFGLSVPLAKTGINWWRTADLWAVLMRDVLGYEKFCAHGGDWGTLVTLQLGHRYADRVHGVHVTGLAPSNSSPATAPGRSAAASTRSRREPARRRRCSPGRRSSRATSPCSTSTRRPSPGRCTTRPWDCSPG